MSGRDIVLFQMGEEEVAKELLKRSGKIVVEPFLDRIHDFSQYVFPDGKIITYENIVDAHYQYKGTYFPDLNHPYPENLSFFSDITTENWLEFKKDLKRFMELLDSEGAISGYSLDSFVYREGGQHKIRSVCEINYRKTMGLIAWLLSKKYASSQKSSMLVLAKKMVRENIFQSTLARSRQVENCLYLSPGDTRFEIFFISGSSSLDVKEKLNKLILLLPECQFPIKI
jgi:hypothetical protein